MKSSAPDLVDASILDVALNEIDFRYEWSHADLSGQADVLDSYGNVARLTSDRRLLLTEGSSVRLSGSSLSGNSDAEVWIFSTPRLLDKIEIGENGLFTSQIAVPDDLEVGEHTILFSAKTLDGRVVAVNFPALVTQRSSNLETTTTGEQTTSTNVRPLKTSTSVAPQSSTTTTKPATTTTTTTKPATTTTTTTKPATTTTTTKPATTTTTTKPATTKPATTKPATTKPATTTTTTTTTSTTIAPTTTTTTTTTTPTIAPTSTTIAPTTTTIAPTIAPTTTTIAPTTTTIAPTTTTIAPTTTTTLPDTSAPTVTLARTAATSSSASVSFTITGNEAITCSTLSLISDSDFALTNISTITSITQTSSTVCTIVAVSTATTNGVGVVSTLTAAASFSVTDTAGNAQTTLVDSPQSVTVTRNGVPDAPTTVAGTAGNTTVALTWVAPASTGGSSITDYVVQYSSDSGSTWTTFADDTSTSTSATVTGLTNGTSYIFHVAATNSVGTGSYSTSSSAVTPVTYAVVYSANTATSGSVPSDATAYSNGATVTVLGNTGVLAKTGFTFGGWCTTQPAAGSACTGTPRVAASSFAITDNVTLYAVWTTAYLTISYLYVDTVTGQAPSTPTTVAYGSTFVTPANTFSRSGYVFAGWHDGTATYAPDITYPTSGTVSAEVNLLATWTPTCAMGGACIVGETGPGGGVVFYAAGSTFASPGSACNTAGVGGISTCKYLEAAPSDHSSVVAWCSNTTSALGTTGKAIGTGMANTTTAATTCTTGAIQIAAGYEYNSKTDWHLPSIYEWSQLYIQRAKVGGFSTDCYYWSSSESSATAWVQSFFITGGQNTRPKSTTNYVRPVRAFG